MKLSVQASKDVMDNVRNVIARPAALQEIGRALPKSASKFLTPERMTQIAMTSFAKTPKLWDCDPRAIFRCLLECAQLGLEPSAGGSMAQAYLLPYGKECSVSVTWQGWLTLARRSDAITKIQARCVFARDEFHYSHTLDGLRFEHIPYDGEDDRGELVKVYCIWQDAGDWRIEVMTRADVEKRKKASPSGNNGPWGTWYNEMALKTVIKKAAKWWPRITEIEEIADREDDVPPTGSTIIEAQLPKKSRSDALADSIGAPDLFEDKSDGQPEGDASSSPFLEDT